MTDETTSRPEPTEPATADWAGVGESFRSLGRQLSGRARSAKDDISSATGAAEGAADQVGAAFRTAVDSLDATTTDPEVRAATRTATAKLLDAIKAELTGEPRTSRPETPEPPKELRADGQ